MCARGHDQEHRGERRGLDDGTARRRFIKSKVNAAKNRLVSLSRIQGTSSYAAVFGSNTGTDKLTWWWYYGLDCDADRQQRAGQPRARRRPRSQRRHRQVHAVMYANPSGTPWYMYVGLHRHRARQQGPAARSAALRPHPVLVRWAHLLRRRDDQQLQRRDHNFVGALAGEVPNGNWGFELKQVGGPVLTGVQTDTAFEPASTMKVLYHYKSILAEQAGATRTRRRSLPLQPGRPEQQRHLPGQLQQHRDDEPCQRRHADDAGLRQPDDPGHSDKYGKPAMLAEAARLGMTHTQINHNIGCPTATTHNYTSLSDLANLYSAFSTRTDITRDQVESGVPRPDAERDQLPVGQDRDLRPGEARKRPRWASRAKANASAPRSPGSPRVARTSTAAPTPTRSRGPTVR